jgi:hypothetical protein
VIVDLVPDCYNKFVTLYQCISLLCADIVLYTNFKMSRVSTFETDMTTNTLNLPENMEDQILLFKKFNIGHFKSAISTLNPVIKKYLDIQVNGSAVTGAYVFDEV